MVHKNARLTPHGRLLLVRQIIEEGWRIADAVQAAGISERQSYRWLARYRRGSAAALADRSSAPQHSGPATLQASIGADRVGDIERLRRQRMSGPAVARQLHMPVSTVGAILRRLSPGQARRARTEAGVGALWRERPGELIHIDSEKLERIDGR